MIEDAHNTDQLNSQEQYLARPYWYYFERLSIGLN